jgi:2-polyprenyl-3-methyl-5-hydroxy-6-metoxy-1,4-benzoquinol methylase
VGKARPGPIEPYGTVYEMARARLRSRKNMTEPVRPLQQDKEPEVNIQKLMEQIRERVREDAQKHRDTMPAMVPTAARFSDEQGIKAGSLQHSENLRFLNLNYAFETKLSPDRIVTHRSGVVGRIIVKLKRKLLSFLRTALFNDYLQAERQYQENLVRYLNEVGRYIDARDGQLFGELVRKVDGDVTRIADRVGRVDDEKTSAIFALEHDFLARLARVDSLVCGLEGIINNLRQYTSQDVPQAEEGASTRAAKADLSYLLLENRYRGAESEIERRLRVYPPLFRRAPGTVLEIGSGRGELQRLFKESGVSSYGVDLDVVMVNVANSHGCNTKYGDGIAHLRTLADKSLGGIIAIQVVEHLTSDQLRELMELGKAKVKKGGTIVFETINPQSLLALSSNYFRDPTHVWPLHPDMLGYMATLAGLTVKETKMLSPVSPHYLLKELPSDSSHTPAVAEAVRRLNLNMQQLNSLLYGFQDYCLVLEVVS